ncbi:MULTISPECIES: hypothetical protein [unclassified Bradyrhizobium]|uniref:hypothetical protein n=1 Tax=unclassified Bradyrhizobium TaxID=2631580 RepID=UPI002479F6A9|nr:MULTISPECIES: hypothetical protein [unclassified Bradyrhizobium]WGR75362.1 hypothetical protein MTX24_35690 [Bradyrhizobium sp. ISRA426]WGR82989.1 hypothetical protein MTX21_20795 [Bradyrhizobium sp. ISRA430]WGR90566.1 hypothetical protein MTX25_35380 [Bradyrhizobium sp. ISRA432]
MASFHGARIRTSRVSAKRYRELIASGHELIRAKNDFPKPLFANAALALRGEQRWQGMLVFASNDAH